LGGHVAVHKGYGDATVKREAHSDVERAKRLPFVWAGACYEHDSCIPPSRSAALQFRAAQNMVFDDAKFLAEIRRSPSTLQIAQFTQFALGKFHFSLHGKRIYRRVGIPASWPFHVWN
jgi:hypothetical protein